MCLKVPLTVFLLFLTNYNSAQETDHTPAIGRKGNKCYDEFKRPQRCIPEFENAAFGVLMEATNTCGDHGEVQYCVQTGVTGTKKFCDWCYPNQHHAQYLTDFHHNDRPTWWQSESMQEGITQVNLTLKLGKAFDITYVRLWFYSPRPESFAIYKKTHEGGPWIPYQYYSAYCRETYGLPDSVSATRGDEKRALCTSEYSDISPLRGGNVAFGTLEGRPSAYNFDSSPELQEWVTATELMITLDRLNTFGDEVFGDPNVLRSYFYAIADVAVGARCKCNGHANQCINSTGVDGIRRRVCQCEHNTAGPDCNECKPFFNDAPWRRATAQNAYECKECNCNGYSNRCYFDQELYDRTGHGGHCLDCMANRDGPNCEKCRENYYMREDGYCIPCDCDPVGSRYLQCNIEGKCQCQPGVTGDKCDRCEVNYHAFSSRGCESCGCSEAGSLHNQPNCDPDTGDCVCKENVEGEQCRDCKPGYFNIDLENEFGCTPCFCYGHSSQCQSAGGYSKYQIESLFTKGTEKWRAEDEFRRNVNVQHNPLTQSVSVQAVGDEAVYFLAPSRYLGDQRASYNQLMEFKLRVGENRPVPTATDIILEGNGQFVTNTIFAQHNKIPSIEEQVYKFRLHEHPDYGWQPRLSARAFMSILTNLTAIRIKGTYAPQGVGVLDDFKLETAVRGIAGEPANWIEICTCPEGYVGQFCELCAPGYRHSPSLGGPFMPCILCDCNKHAELCDSETGKCICRDNTAGDNCEVCARGFYGNALEGTPYDCKPCDCPNNGPCIQLDEDIIMCTECPPGRTGYRCDACADGYFGDPANGIDCQSCKCNDNIDENAIGNCNTTTGECLKCIYSTDGPRCEYCLPGYYGNALAVKKPDCRPCECYPVGTLVNTEGSPDCSQTSGTCFCKPHVVGKNCDQCENGYFNLMSGEGCEACNCNPIGSLNQTCDLITGQCFCKPGVTGLRCDHCEARKYGFSNDGCKDCDCDPIGSKDLQCDDFGQCPCLENVEGRRCEFCKENKYDRQRGCVDCPDCYNLVQDAYRAHTTKLQGLQGMLDEIERQPTVIPDEKFPSELENLQREIDEFHDKVTNATGEDSIIQQVQDINEREKEITRTLSEIDENVYTATNKVNSAKRNLSNTEAILDEIEDKLGIVKDMLEIDGKRALESAQERANLAGQQSDNMTQIAHQARQIADELDKEAEGLQMRADEAKNKSDEAYAIAEKAVEQQKNITLEEDKLRADLTNTEIKLNRTSEWTIQVSEKAKEAKKDALALLNEVENLVIPDMDIPKIKEKVEELEIEAKELRAETEEIVNENEGLLMQINEDIFEGHDLLDRSVTQQDDNTELLNEVNLSKIQAEEAVKLGDEILNSTRKNYEILKEFDEKVRISQQAAEEALGEIPEIQRILTETALKTHQAQNTLKEANRTTESALQKAIEADELANNASSNAEKIKVEAHNLLENATNLSYEAGLMGDRVQGTESDLKRIIREYHSNETLIKQAKEKVGKAGKETEEVGKKVSELVADVQKIIDELENLPEPDEDAINMLEASLKRAEKAVEEAHLDEVLAELQQKQKAQDEMIANYRIEIETLRKDVENVEQIANALPDGCFRYIKLEP